MDAGSIHAYVKKHITDLNTVFVFPTMVSARHWLEYAAISYKETTIAASRFLSWDQFKAQCMRVSTQNNTAISNALRLLYCTSIAEKNKTAAKKGKTFLSHLIPEEQALDSFNFINWLFNLLPELDFSVSGITQTAGGMVSELYKLKEDYGKFLQSYGLFEPMWLSDFFVPFGTQYVLFYPDLIEDFFRLELLLANQPEVIIVPVPLNMTEQLVCHAFKNTRLELQYIFTETEKLLANGVLPADIAISVSDLKTLQPYIKREAHIRDLPLNIRTGFSLGRHPVGSIFALLQNVEVSHYSFASIKKLLFRNRIPWKHENIIKDFFSYGIQNKCMVSWQDGGVWKNVWEETFNAMTIKDKSVVSIESWFSEFKQQIKKLITAKSFTEMLKQYFIFRNQFIDLDKIEQEDDNVLSRCVRILHELSTLETSFAQYIPKSPAAFFVSLLEKEQYVLQSTGIGVNVFAHGIAASAPFQYHFVIGADQKNGAVLHQPLSAFPPDIRKRQRFSDKDVSADFFCAYHATGKTHFSYSKKTFTGETTAHEAFRIIEETVLQPHVDLYQQEKLFFTGAANLQSVYPIQKQAFTRIFPCIKNRRQEFLNEPLSPNTPSLSKKINDHCKNEGLARVSATTLKLFQESPAQWFLQYALELDDEPVDPNMFNPQELGVLYHIILERIYKKIQNVDNCFYSSHITLYREWAIDIIQTEIKKNIALRGTLAAAFSEPMKQQILSAVEFVFSFDAEFFDGWQQKGIEFSANVKKDDILFTGKVDRIIFNPSEGTMAVLDYKSGKMPTYTAYSVDRLSDFQIPMYILLTESEQASSVVEYGIFLGLKKNERVSIVAPESSAIKKRNSTERDDFEYALESLGEIAKMFKQSLQTYYFPFRDNSQEEYGLQHITRRHYSMVD